MCSKGRVSLWELLPIVSYYLAKFGGHSPCGSRDIFHVTLQHHVIKGPCDFMEGSSS